MDKTAIIDLIDKHEHIETTARALKSIAHPLRLKILCVLGDSEVCVQIAAWAMIRLWARRELRERTTSEPDVLGAGCSAVKEAPAAAG